MLNSNEHYCELGACILENALNLGATRRCCGMSVKRQLVGENPNELGRELWVPPRVETPNWSRSMCGEKQSHLITPGQRIGLLQSPWSGP